MVRQGLVVSVGHRLLSAIRWIIGTAGVGGVLMVSTWRLAAQPPATEPRAPAPKPVTTPSANPVAPPGPATAAAAPSIKEPIDRLPYRVRVLLASDVDARLDMRRRDELLAEWQTLVRRFVGAPWVIEILGESRAEALVLGGELETLDPTMVEPLGANADKVWLVRVSASGAGLVFRGREYDSATRRLGPLQRRVAPVVRDAPRVLLRFTLDLFAPYGEIGERFGKDVALTIRGGSLEPASELGRVVVPGTVFQPFRLVLRKDGPPLVRDIPYTFLRVESAESPGARCSFVSVYSDPFTNRVVQKTGLVALGIKPGQMPTRFRFVTLPDRAPAAGYVFTARSLPDGQPRELGLTDREGRITLAPGVAEGLVVGRLLAGSEEPMIEFPFVPGESSTERLIPAFDPKPQTVTLETRLDSIKDAVIDLVAVRARLLARLKARFDGEDWPGAAEVLKEYSQLPPRDTFAAEVTRLKEEAARQQAQSKSAILTKTAQARITELQSLIERYLDDEEFLGYSEALVKLQAGEKAKPKAAARPSTAPTVGAPVPSTPPTPGDETAQPPVPSTPPRPPVAPSTANPNAPPF